MVHLNSEPLVSIIIPVFNELKTIGTLLEKVEQSSRSFQREIIVVDDGSTDGTSQFLSSLTDPFQILLRDRNQGKGAALRDGFSHSSGEILLTQDGDLEYDPSDYPTLLEPILTGTADVVFGSRFLKLRPGSIHYRSHYYGNRLLTMLTNLLTDLEISDMETGYKVFRRSLLERMDLQEDRFGFEPEFTMKIARMPGIKVCEVPINYQGSSVLEGKKIKWKDGVGAIWQLFKYRYF